MAIAQVQIVWPQALTTKIGKFASLDKSLGKFMPRVEALMKADNRDGLLAGTDKDGKPLVGLALSTIKRRNMWMSMKPLIPHALNARAIANYKTTSFQRSDGSWLAIGAWINVVSKKGVAFLPFHIEGAGNNPVRDIAGVRPIGKKKIQQALSDWVRGQLK